MIMYYTIMESFGNKTSPAKVLNLNKLYDKVK